MKIGVFGGCFNPPHQKHKNIALELIKKKYLDKVIFVPTGDFYKKEGLATDVDRYQMLKILIEKEENLEISCYEFDKLTYTYQTLTYFKEQYMNDEIYFICGSDNLDTFNTWKNYCYILENFKLLVVKRNEDDMSRILNKYRKYIENIEVANISEDRLSSTMIREAFFNKKEDDMRGLIDSNIYRYIKENNLYRNVSV